MKEVILIKNGELALKGLNRRTFEDIMIKNMRRKLSNLGTFTFTPAQSTIKVEGDDGADLEEAVNRLSRVFGIAGFSRALKLDKDFDLVLEQTGKYLEEQLLCASTFKVCAKRSDKKFPYDSPKICLLLGERLLDEYPHLTVDVHNPELTVTVEVRDNDIFVHANQLKGAGGMPVGSAGRAALMVSGGIDSPVAGWMMAKRGIELTAIHFASPPYTSERAEQKVHDLLGKVARYAGRIELSVVPFTEFQEAIRDKCPEDLFTIIMRRMMVLCAQRIASHTGCGALITGESLGQVASQTLGAIACTDEAATMPVFRPLIGMDKDEIISISRKIDTFEISILPFEDCCTVFTPRHPRTRPKLSDVIEAESKLDVDALVERAVAGVRKIVIN
ncbi:MAG: tRNA uracil 4-sulfurtransferase ThiI [Acutalibacteraceae bacterium]|nr:tRNA uracil 4-sulfurtransferase ThiI [Acutalibacteraceae bacterium]